MGGQRRGFESHHPDQFYLKYAGYAGVKSPFDESDRALLDIAREFGRPDLRIVSRIKFGHTDSTLVLPIGVLARLDFKRREFAILDSAVLR